ncbi:hypothetical protein EV175_000241 [Coemansia sp. RSA 1933]|nr:hypothetical protein EV175_000241 [Coemansia sp. RSA 1933]
MDKHSLSQSDFRRLLSENASAPKRQKRIPQQKPKKPTTAAHKRYRDRAAERRVGTEDAGDRYNADAMTYDESKFLGGDVERTHLVKGLDYLLLEKNRSKKGADDALESTPEHSVAQENGANTVLGMRVLAACSRLWQTAAASDIATNELFAPGRMYFEFGTTSAQCAMTVRLRSQEELARYLACSASASSKSIPESDWLVLNKVIAAISKPVENVDSPPREKVAVPTPSAAIVGEEEEDIFEGAGV